MRGIRNDSEKRLCHDYTSMSISEFAYAGLEEAFNQYLALDPAAKERMWQLHGRAIALELKGFDTTLYFIPGPGRLQLLAHYEGDLDCSLSGTPIALLQLLRRQMESAPVIPEEIGISGDRDLAQRFIAILQTTDIDWEGHLSRYTGELFAQEMGRVVRGGLAWGEHVANTLRDELQGMLQEEDGPLPKQEEYVALCADIDRLSDRTDQLETRIAALTPPVRKKRSRKKGPQ